LCRKLNKGANFETLRVRLVRELGGEGRVGEERRGEGRDFNGGEIF